VCDAHEDALLHVAKPRGLLCDKTDKDVERWLSIVITACLVVIVCAELLSLSPHANAVSLQGGEGAEDASNCTSLFEKKSPIIGLFCGKSPVQMRRPMHPRHPVFVFCSPRLGVVLLAPPYGSEPNKRHSLSLQPRRLFSITAS